MVLPARMRHGGAEDLPHGGAGPALRRRIRPRRPRRPWTQGPIRRVVPAAPLAPMAHAPQPRVAGQPARGWNFGWHVYWPSGKVCCSTIYLALLSTGGPHERDRVDRCQGGGLLMSSGAAVETGVIRTRFPWPASGLHRRGPLGARHRRPGRPRRAPPPLSAFRAPPARLDARITAIISKAQIDSPTSPGSRPGTSGLSEQFAPHLPSPATGRGRWHPTSWTDPGRACPIEEAHREAGQCPARGRPGRARIRTRAGLGYPGALPPVSRYAAEEIAYLALADTEPDAALGAC